MQMISLKCPECGASLEVEEGRDLCYCQYCGAKIAIKDENTYTIRNIDEAKIKQAETDRMVKMRELDIDEKERHLKRKILIVGAAVCAALGIVGCIGVSIHNAGMEYSLLAAVVLFSLGVRYINKNKDINQEKKNIQERKIKIHKASSDYKGKNYEAVKTEFESNGFLCIKTIPMRDLTTGLVSKPSTIASVSIGGKDKFNSGEWFPQDAPVIITYHSFTSEKS